MMKNKTVLEDYINSLATNEEQKNAKMFLKIINRLLFVVNVLLAPLAFMLNFNWFIVPTLNAHPVGYLVSFGIIMLVDFLIFKSADVDKGLELIEYKLSHNFASRTAGILLSSYTIILGTAIHWLIVFLN